MIYGLEMDNRRNQESILIQRLCKIAFPEGLPPIWHKKSMFLTNINLFEPDFNTIKNSGQKIYPRDFTAPEKFMKFETFWAC